VATLVVLTATAVFSLTVRLFLARSALRLARRPR
jgi:hypothetical protein